MAKKLYGTDPDQVPTNADLGTMAYQDANLFTMQQDTNGDFIVFRQGGTEVGVVSSSGGSLLVGEGSAGVKFNSGSTKIIPRGTNNQNVDGTIDFGGNGDRWKDLYLSGGVVFGDAGGSGTSSSNTLDSYEEGTWTPAIEYDTNGTLSVTYSQRNGAYTKVGNMVTIWGVIRLNGFSKGTASGSLKFTGLPFSSTAVGYRTDLKVLTYRAPFNGPGGFGAMIDNGSSYIACVYSRNDNTWTAEADPDSNSEYFFAGSYFTA